MEYIPGIPSQSNRQEEIKAIQIGKEIVKI
jgi:hypothetical protein